MKDYHDPSLEHGARLPRASLDLSDLGSEETMPEIPVIDLAGDGFHSLISRHGRHLHDIIRIARAEVSGPLVNLGDNFSRSWARRVRVPYLDEIEKVSNMARMPGIWLLNLGYEWGCTTALRPNGKEDPRPNFLRTLDWSAPGLGRLMVAARRETASGMWLNLTWPGFVGCFQGVAPQRFAASINQAPRRTTGLGYSMDWIFNRMRVWKGRNTPPVLLLRKVFDEAKTFQQARAMLINTPITTPVIFTLVGTRPDQMLRIERLEERAIVHEGIGAATNHWLSEGLTGKPYFEDSKDRLKAMQDYLAKTKDGDRPPLEWAKVPIIDFRTKLAMEAWPATGRVRVQGYESEQPVTAPLDITIREWKDPMKG
jgi:hypothetical protein